MKNMGEYMEIGNKIDIIPATNEDLDCCSEILKQTELGMNYFINSKGQYIGKELLKEGFDKNEIYISKINSSQEIIGFCWIQSRGIFNWFPFLHVLVVSVKYQGMGYGKKHMEHFEELCNKVYKADKAFLIVAEDNEIAKNLYNQLEYKEIGRIPSLLIEGIDEILMFKTIK